ncbi:unnamed protein product [Mytilus coruscus]|uniref:Uncharacterized protein n=1 Tax=Mytilus coruscus TaxID=42192 RepID=A0A6J8EL10_MYTCO|nr:unnamed protein product [Mytilus coruscus]
MAGSGKGVAARIEDQYPKAVYNHCASHWLRENVDCKFLAWYEEAVVTEKDHDIESSVPRTCSRQRNRCNVPGETPDVYFRRALCITYIDELISGINDRFSSLSKTAVMALVLIPEMTIQKQHANVILENLKPFLDFYNSDLPSPCGISSEVDRVEEQEQYSRRTSLRFNNIKIPTNGNGRIIKPINTDFLVLQICNEQLGLDINLKDLSRTHPIGKVKNGKMSVIVRFLSYRTRQLVFSNKKKLKNNEDKLFISENLTKYRYGLMKHLNVLRFTEKIHSFWTHDGKIIAKETPESDYIVISCNQDIRDLGGEISDEDDDY